MNFGTIETAGAFGQDPVNVGLLSTCYKKVTVTIQGISTDSVPLGPTVQVRGNTLIVHGGSIKKECVCLRGSGHFGPGTGGGAGPDSYKPRPGGGFIYTKTYIDEACGGDPCNVFQWEREQDECPCCCACGPFDLYPPPLATPELPAPSWQRGPNSPGDEPLRAILSKEADFVKAIAENKNPCLTNCNQWVGPVG